MAARTTRAQAPAPTDPDELVLVPLGRIAPSPLNPRKTFDQAELQELATSIHAHGVLQPVLLRPWPKDQPQPSTGADYDETVHYELVDGERRWRAACLAGLKVIRATVRNLSDRDVLEIAVVTCEQRADVPALEKAAAYAQLVEQHGVSVEDLAKKIGKSVSAVRGLLKLRQLPKNARAALEAGELQPAIAGLLARIPGDRARQEATATVLAGSQIWHSKGEPLTYRQVKELIEQNYTVELKAAPFNRKALDLVPSAGPCEQCPKRVGNLQAVDPEGYAGVRADVCTDPACYRAKVAAWQGQVAADATAKGQRILTEEQADRVFAYQGVLSFDAPYFDLADQCEKDKAKKTPRSYKQLLDGHFKESDVTLAYDEDGKLHRLVSKELALPVLKAEHGLYKDGDPSAAAGRRDDAAIARRRAEDKLRAETAQRCMAALVARAEALFRVVVAEPDTRDPTELAMLEDAVRALIPGVAGELWGETLTKVLKRRGQASGHFHEKEKSVKQIVAGLDGPGLFGLLAELGAAKAVLLPNWSSSQDRGQVLKAFGVDWKKVESEVKAEKKEKKAKGKPAKKAAEAGPAPEVAFARPGDVVRTSYGTGPYTVLNITKSGTRGGRPEFSLTLRRVGDQKSTPSHLNGYQVQTDGRVTAANGDELFVLPAGADPGPTWPDWLQAAGLINKPVDVSLKLCWMRGEPAPGAKGKAKAKKKAAAEPSAEGKLLIDRSTLLADLVVQASASAAAQVLEAAGVETVGQLLDKAGPPKPNRSPTSHVYSYLREIPGLQAQAANEIGDALVDAELIGGD